MDCIEAILNRRSCRSFLDKPVEDEKIQQILECAIYAPSPANKQPWEFIVTHNPEYGRRLREQAEKTREYVASRSGWKWIPHYKVDFVSESPVLIVVVANPAKNGAEQFLNEPSNGSDQACSAAVQNICLAAHSLGLGTLWFSFFEKADARAIFGIPQEKDPMAIVCLGYPSRVSSAPARQGLAEKVRYLD